MKEIDITTLNFSTKDSNLINESAKRLSNLFKNTNVCLKNNDISKELISQASVFVFVDNEYEPRIILDINNQILTNFRGTDDKKEENISEEYLDVANDFLNQHNYLFDANKWQQQINWIHRLREYNTLFQHKKYGEIDVKQLINDLAYNGFSLHYETHHNQYGFLVPTTYYPVAKRKLFKQSMLIPMIAKELNCRTSEIEVGAYYGNGKHTKYIIGDLKSANLCTKCSILRVFGSIDVNNYYGPFDINKINCDGNFYAQISNTKLINDMSNDLSKEIINDSQLNI